MSEETQVGSEAASQTSGEGTTPGQSNQSIPNDPAAFQAGYTRKFQELAQEKQALQAEKAQLEAERAAIAAQRNQSSYNANPGYTRNDPTQALVEQFGQEAAHAIIAANQTQVQQITKSQFDLLYTLEEQKGKSKYGEEEWNKHNYYDPRTGEQRNKIMDFRLAANPITGQSLTLDQAWAAANPIDPKSMEQSIRDKVYAEINEKAQATPSQASTSNPASTGKGHATSIEQAAAQAASEVGWQW